MMISSSIFCQVGINTATPSATLDVRAKTTTGTSSAVDGLLVPRVDRQKAQSMTGIPTSTLIYVTNASTGATGANAGNAINIDAAGYYYFDESSVWTKLKTPAGTPAADINIYNNNGTLQSNRTVAQTDKTLAFTSTATTGTNHFSVDGSTLSVDAVNNRVGIGTTTPAVKLEINNGTTAGAVKIVDGTQATNRVLMSDADGVGTWKTLTGGSSWYGVLSGGSTNTQPSQINFTGARVIGSGGTASSTTDAITVPATGLYEVTISGWTCTADCATNPTPAIPYTTIWSIKRNGTTLTGSPFYGSPNVLFGTNMSTVKYYRLTEGDVITLFLDNPYGISKPATQAGGIALAMKLIQ